MMEYEVVKIVKAILKNKIITLSFILLPFVISTFEYSMLQTTTLSFGIIFIFIALFMFYTNNKISNSWTETTGKVIDIKWHNETLNSGQTRPYGQEVITYKTKILNDYTVMNDVSNPKPNKRGQKIKIYYNPKNEKEILVYDFFNMYLKFFFLILFGIIMIYYTVK